MTRVVREPVSVEAPGRRTRLVGRPTKPGERYGSGKASPASVTVVDAGAFAEVGFADEYLRPVSGDSSRRARKSSAQVLTWVDGRANL
jgi:hypothetical protein